MPYTGVHKLLTVNGTTYNAERFTFGIRFSGSDAPTQAMVDQMHAAAKALFLAAPLGISGSSSFNYCKLAQIGVDGKYPPGTVPAISTAENVQGIGGTGTLLGPQVCLAVTTTTALIRGRASKGRFYLPHLAIAPNLNGVLSWSLPPTTALNALRTFLLSINGAGAGAASVMSKFGPVAPITGLKLGNRYDIQRSRGRSIPENYQSIAL